jgi:hypothetical protein
MVSCSVSSADRTVNVQKPLKKLSSEFGSARETEKHRFCEPNRRATLIAMEQLAG